MRGLVAVLGSVVALLLVGVSGAQAAPLFVNGFEADTHGWDVFGGQFDATRVPSGTHGITSASGSYHAEAVQCDLDHCGGSAATDWGGYNSAFPPGGYMTSVDVYLDPSSGAANDTRFDWDSAVSDASGGFRRDFVFNAGFYNDSDATGTGPRFVITASNNAGRGGAFPKNPARDPFTITSAGWYTFQHRFRDDGSGVLAVDLSILDAGGNVLHTWTLSDPTDVIGTTVGGNRYGWFASNEFPFLAFDNSLRRDLNATTISMGPQAMEGDLKVSPGDTLNAGYDFTMPGKHPAATVMFSGGKVTFQATCVSGSGGGTITVPLADSLYTDPANSSQWYPSGDQHSSLTFQGSTSVPALCGPSGKMSLKKGGTFTSALQSTDIADKVNVRWHYSANGSAGGWSGTASFVPGS